MVIYSKDLPSDRVRHWLPAFLQLLKNDIMNKAANSKRFGRKSFRHFRPFFNLFRALQHVLAAFACVDCIQLNFDEIELDVYFSFDWMVASDLGFKRIRFWVKKFSKLMNFNPDVRIWFARFVRALRSPRKSLLGG